VLKQYGTTGPHFELILVIGDGDSLIAGERVLGVVSGLVDLAPVTDINRVFFFGHDAILSSTESAMWIRQNIPILLMRNRPPPPPLDGGHQILIEDSISSRKPLRACGAELRHVEG